MKRLFLLAALAILPTQAFAMFGCGCCDGGFADGFRAGLFGSFSRINYNIQHDTMVDANMKRTYQLEAVQKAEGGGAFVGYACPVWGCWGVALQFDGIWNGGTAGHAVTAEDINERSIVRIRNRYMLDLSVQPQVMITQCFLGYFKFGVSWADCRLTYEFHEDDAPFGINDRDSRTRTPTGYVLGAGFRTGITCWLSAFAEFDWRCYSSSLPKTRDLRDQSGSEPDQTVRGEIKEMFATSYVFGLMASF